MAKEQEKAPNDRSAPKLSGARRASAEEAPEGADAKTVKLRALKNIPPQVLGRGEGGRREYAGAEFEVDGRIAHDLVKRRKIAEEVK